MSYFFDMNVKSFEKIVFFGGAGTSTESGIPDFRSATGLYNKVPEELLSHDSLIHHTEEFFEFYKKRLVYPDAKPNPGHYILRDLEESGRLLGIITQNIDGLHQKAGSKNVVEIHGNLIDHYCMNCHKKYDKEYSYNSEGVPRCEVCGGIVRPDVTLYGEMLKESAIEKAIDLLKRADLLILSGSSFVVQPAAGLVHLSPAKKILINLVQTVMDAYVDEILHVGFSQGLKQLFLE